MPTQVVGNKGESLYFGQDHEFLRPKGAISLKILFPKDIMSPEHRAHSRIYAACVNESLNELSYPARLAGLNYSIKEGYEGIYVDVSGYKESSLRLFKSTRGVKYLSCVNFGILSNRSKLNSPFSE